MEFTRTDEQLQQVIDESERNSEDARIVLEEAGFRRAGGEKLFGDGSGYPPEMTYAQWTRKLDAIGMLDCGLQNCPELAIRQHDGGQQTSLIKYFSSDHDPFGEEKVAESIPVPIEAVTSEGVREALGVAGGWRMFGEQALIDRQFERSLP